MTTTITPHKPPEVEQAQHALRRQHRATRTIVTITWTVVDARTGEQLFKHSDSAQVGASMFIPDRSDT